MNTPVTPAATTPAGSPVARGVVRWLLVALLARPGSGTSPRPRRFGPRSRAGCRGPRLVIPVSGVVELALAAALAFAPVRHRPLVGWVVAAFFVAVFPGNVSQYVTGTAAFGLETDAARLVRLLFQPCTRRRRAVVDGRVGRVAVRRIADTTPSQADDDAARRSPGGHPAQAAGASARRPPRGHPRSPAAACASTLVWARCGPSGRCSCTRDRCRPAAQRRGVDRRRARAAAQVDEPPAVGEGERAAVPARPPPGRRRRPPGRRTPHAPPRPGTSSSAQPDDGIRPAARWPATVPPDRRRRRPAAPRGSGRLHRHLPTAPPAPRTRPVLPAKSPARCEHLPGGDRRQAQRAPACHRGRRDETTWRCGDGRAPAPVAGRHARRGGEPHAAPRRSAGP